MCLLECLSRMMLGCYYTFAKTFTMIFSALLCGCERILDAFLNAMEGCCNAVSITVSS